MSRLFWFLLFLFLTPILIPIAVLVTLCKLT